MLNFSAGYLAENLHGLTEKTPWNRTRKAVVFGAESMEKISETCNKNSPSCRLRMVKLQLKF